MSMRIHRYGRFDANGAGLHWGALCWEGSPTKPVPPPDHACPGSYVVPLDDQVAQWQRLAAESAVHGHCRHATHSGGLPHPDYPHLRQGGTVAWSEEPHPAVQARIGALAATSHDDLVAHLTGRR